MNTNRFIRNFLALREALQTQNFSSKEINQVCMQGALEFEKLYLQESQNALSEEQARSKMEIEYLSAQYNLEAIKAQTLNSLIQCQSMLRSLKDNAAINRANAYVGFLQVVANASNLSGVSAHAGNVIATINKIGQEGADDKLKACLENLEAELEELNSLEGAGDQVQIYAQSLETLPNYPVRVYGFSTLKNSQDGFLVDGQQAATGATMLFCAQEPKVYTITFESVNKKTRAAKSLDILVSDEKIEKLK